MFIFFYFFLIGCKKYFKKKNVRKEMINYLINHIHILRLMYLIFFRFGLYILIWCMNSHFILTPSVCCPKEKKNGTHSQIHNPNKIFYIRKIHVTFDPHRVSKLPIECHCNFQILDIQQHHQQQ